MQEPIRVYLAERGLAGRYSQFTIAGGAIGVVAPSFEAWHATFWDNLDVTVKLHRVKRVIAINHRNCGAGSIAFGPEKFAGRAAETSTHHQVLATFRDQIIQHHPRLVVETGLMALDGSIMMFK